MEIWRGQQEGLAIIIVNPGVIIGPGFPEQGSGQLLKQVAAGLPFYTLGTTGFVAVSDVVRIAVELTKSEIRNQRYTLIAKNIVFQDLLNTMADALNVKRPTIHITPFLMEISWRIDWIMATIFRRKRQLTQNIAKASYAKNDYSNEKIKSELATTFTDIHHYIKEISNL
jgi:dihydroflavonol-4-reductase